MLGINPHFHHTHHQNHANRPLNLDCASSSSSVRPPSPSSESHPPRPPQIQAKRNPKLVSFLLQAFIMTLVFSLFFVFVGIAVIVFLHLCLVGGALHRRHRRFRTRPNDDNPSGLSPDEIRSLPRFRFRKQSSPELCAICLDNCADGVWCRELPECKHVFHSGCVDRWLAKSPGCPVCRAIVRIGGRSEEESGGIENCGGGGGQLWYAFR